MTTALSSARVTAGEVGQRAWRAMAIIKGKGFSENCGFYKSHILATFLIFLALSFSSMLVGAVLILITPLAADNVKQCAASSLPATELHTGFDIIPGGVELSKHDDLTCCEHCAGLVGSVMWVYNIQNFKCFCKSKVGPKAPCGESIAPGPDVTAARPLC